MTEKDFKDLEDRYFVVKRGKVWAFAGGIVGILAVTGLVSYQGALSAVRSSSATNAIQRLEKNAAESDTLILYLSNALITVSKQTNNLPQLVDERVARHRKVMDLERQASEITNVIDRRTVAKMYQLINRDIKEATDKAASLLKEDENPRTTAQRKKEIAQQREEMLQKVRDLHAERGRYAPERNK